MKKRFRTIWVRSGKLLCLCLVLLASACGESKLDVSTLPLEANQPDEISYKVAITEFDQGLVSYILQADRVERFNDRRIMRAYRVEITAFEKKKPGFSTIKADSTIVDDARNLIYAYGNVQFTSPGGSVASSRMIWDRNMDLVTAPDQVTLTRFGNVVRGKNLRTNLSIYPTEMDSVSAEGFFNEEDLAW